MHLRQVYCAILQHQIENIESLNVLDIFFLILLEYLVVQCCLSLPTTIRPISKDHIFHTVLFYFCKFLICPNQHFFIFNLNFYYQQFKKEIDNYYNSLDSKLYRNEEAEKSLNNIKYYIRTKLEMDELKLHMDDNSISNLISEYSSLQFYKDNYEKIRREMEQWNNGTMEK